jgi:formate hydrogenlyase subunit 6/NADH:ubiquinone oxidoreductase subunit I
MGTGPKARRGFDLALTELLDEQGHRFLVEVGTEAGAALVERLDLPDADDETRRAAEREVSDNARSMTRWLDTTDLRGAVLQNLEHPRWDDVASRCLACTNCTMVCPTCFCTTVEDSTNVAGDEAERSKRWDSCFSEDFSYVAGGSVRASIKSRYRQWLSHKLVTWVDQFGSSGCVGCGRCITWCPVGIDLTEEVRALQSTARRREVG